MDSGSNVMATVVRHAEDGVGIEWGELAPALLREVTAALATADAPPRASQLAQRCLA